jgi:hypothetical protein
VLQVAKGDAASQIGPNLVVVQDQGYVSIRDEAVEEAFYGGCTDEDVALARLLLQHEALAPLATPLHVIEQNFGAVPRIYIETLRDKAITPAMQKQMYGATPCQRVVSMDTSHSPFFSAPEQLVAHLTSL